MKQTIILIIALTLAFAQGWAFQADTTRNNPYLKDVTGREISVNLDDGSGFDGISSVSGGTNATVLGQAPQIYADYDDQHITNHTFNYYKDYDYNDVQEIEVKIYSMNVNKSLSVKLEGKYANKFKINGTNYLIYNHEQADYFISEYEGVKVKITYSSFTEGEFNAKLVIKEYNGSKYGPSWTVNLTGKTMKAAISAKPRSINVGEVKIGKSGSATFIVKATNLPPAANLSLSSNHSKFTVSPRTIKAADVAKGQGVTVKVTYKPTTEGFQNATINIRGGGADSVDVSASGIGVKPHIQPTVNSLSFKTTKNVPVQKTFTLTGKNLDGPVYLSSDNSLFTVTPTSLTIDQAKNGATITVRYNPNILGTHTGKITITSKNAATKTVSLRGNCTTLPIDNPPVMIGSVEPDQEPDDIIIGCETESLAMNEVAAGVHEIALDAKIYAEGQNIVIESPVEQKAIISDVAGHALTVQLQAGYNEIPVNSGGLYIVRIREKSAKLLIR